MGTEGKAEHRLVVETHFERELREGEQVHHINGNRFDNRLCNLVIVSAQAHSYLHNNKYEWLKSCVICEAYYTPHKTKRKISKVCSSKCKVKLDKVNAAKRKKPIAQLTLDGSPVEEWDSARDIQNDLGFREGNINKCCRGFSKTAYGYTWKYI